MQTAKAIESTVQTLSKSLIEEIEERVWARLEPRIQQELQARHMTVGEAAEYLHVSTQTVRRLIHDHQIAHFRVRAQILLRQVDIDRWVEKQVGATGGDSQ